MRMVNCLHFKRLEFSTNGL